MSYQIRGAIASDLPALVALRAEAEQWMHAAGIHQWVGNHHTHARKLLRNAVDAGTAWVVLASSNVVATITLNGPDEDYWTADDDPDAALYVYKMMVARSHSGQHLGAAMLDWANQEALKQGKQWLRLDCRRDNYKLHNYYQQHGFELVRIMNTPLKSNTVRYSGALFQRPTGMKSMMHSTTLETVTK